MEIHYFKNQIVRDLAWIISSPPLINDLEDVDDIELLSTSFFNNEFEKNKNFLIEVDKNPSELIEFIRNSNSNLLGKYFERLVEFWLLNSDDKKLLASNIQLKEKNKTIGEIDFIYKNLQNNKVYHLEVAGKFYISYQNKSEWKNFIGPNTNDNLEKKLNKLFDSQIKLSRTEAAKKIFSELNINCDIIPQVMIKGYLFYDYAKFYSDSCIIPANANPAHEKGWKLHSNKIKEHLKNENSYWMILPRMNWISRVVNPDKKKVLNLDELHKKLDQYFLNNTYPLIIVELNKDESGNLVEDSRGFVVSNNWPFIKRHKMNDKIA